MFRAATLTALALFDSIPYIPINSGKTGFHPQTSIGIYDGLCARFFVSKDEPKCLI